MLEVPLPILACALLRSWYGAGTPSRKCEGLHRIIAHFLSRKALFTLRGAFGCTESGLFDLVRIRRGAMYTDFLRLCLAPLHRVNMVNMKNCKL